MQIGLIPQIFGNLQNTLPSAFRNFRLSRQRIRRRRLVMPAASATCSKVTVLESDVRERLRGVGEIGEAIGIGWILLINIIKIQKPRYGRRGFL